MPTWSKWSARLVEAQKDSVRFRELAPCVDSVVVAQEVVALLG